ncbi:MAG: hypothetical protein WCZ90_12780 [Melioribacteraceae bacterium]
MSKKKLIKLGGKVARGLIDLLEEELTGEKRKKKKEKTNEREKVSSVDRSSNRSS